MAMEALEQRPLIYDEAEIARAGVFVKLDRDGSLTIYREYVRPADEPREEAAAQDEEDGALPERLVMELTARRTPALREAIGRSPDVALTLLLLKLVTDTFRISSATGSCLEISVRHVYMSAQSADLKDSVVATLVYERHDAWEADLPLGDDAVLWDYLTVLDQGSRLSLLAHCLSFGINALHEKVNPYGAGKSPKCARPKAARRSPTSPWPPRGRASRKVA